MRNTLIILGFLLLFSKSANAQGGVPFVQSSTSATGRNQVTIQNQGSGAITPETTLSNLLNQSSIILKREGSIAARIQTRSELIEKSGINLGDVTNRELQINNEIDKAGVILIDLSASSSAISSYSAQEYASYRNRLKSFISEIQAILRKEKQLVLILKELSLRNTDVDVSR